MKLKKIYIIIISSLFLYSCAEYKINKAEKIIEKKYYSSHGFALVYSDILYKDKIIKKKLKNNNIEVIHNFLKPRTPIKIINPDNGISIDAKVSKKSPFPKIFNAVITEKIALVLKLDTENPYIEIREVKKNEKFIAKEGNMFEEEKNVADKAPVNEIMMDVITKNEEKITKTKSKKITKYTLVISDFYYLDSANNLKNELIEKNNIVNISIEKINNNKYRLLAGPFENFNALKTTYISLNNLGFEDLNIYKE